jgi:hypothetical protein
MQAKTNKFRLIEIRSVITGMKHTEERTDMTSPLCVNFILTPWSEVHLWKLVVAQLVRKSPSFYGTRRFITVFTRARCSQSIPSYPVCLRFILIIFFRLRLNLTMVFSIQVFQLEFCMNILFSLMRATCTADLILHLINLTIFGED